MSSQLGCPKTHRSLRRSSPKVLFSLRSRALSLKAHRHHMDQVTYTICQHE